MLLTGLVNYTKAINVVNVALRSTLYAVAQPKRCNGASAKIALLTKRYYLIMNGDRNELSREENKARESVSFEVKENL